MYGSDASGEAAWTGGHSPNRDVAYDGGLHRAFDAERNISNRALAERLIVEDIQMAADVLRPVYDHSEGANGFVSLEVSPGSAHDTAATVAEARHLWQAAARPTVMIKVLLRGMNRSVVAGVKEPG